MNLKLPEGSVFADRYRVVRPIALGAMGAIYEVEHVQTQRHLALKVMLPHVVASPKMRARFTREARVASNIDSDHIVAVLDADVDEATSTPFIVMELLRGEALSKVLARVGRFDASSVVIYIYQVARALDQTHRAHIVHRDLKPDNLFLTIREDGSPRIKILDFGIAKVVQEGEVAAERTRNVGTPLYMAPEQLNSEVPISPQTDVYALGMIAFTLLVGVPYWTARTKASSNLFEFVNSIKVGPTDAASAQARAYGVELPTRLDPWFFRATAPSPADRFASAMEAAAALAEALGVPHLVPAPSATPPAGAVAVSLEPPAEVQAPEVKPPEARRMEEPEAATRLFQRPQNVPAAIVDELSSAGPAALPPPQPPPRRVPLTLVDPPAAPGAAEDDAPEAATMLVNPRQLAALVPPGSAVQAPGVAFAPVPPPAKPRRKLRLLLVGVSVLVTWAVIVAVVLGLRWMNDSPADAVVPARSHRAAANSKK